MTYVSFGNLVLSNYVFHHLKYHILNKETDQQTLSWKYIKLKFLLSIGTSAWRRLLSIKLILNCYNSFYQTQYAGLSH